MPWRRIQVIVLGVAIIAVFYLGLSERDRAQLKEPSEIHGKLSRAQPPVSVKAGFNGQTKNQIDVQDLTEDNRSEGDLISAALRAMETRLLSLERRLDLAGGDGVAINVASILHSADKSLAQGDLESAALYYSNAVHSAQRDWNVLNHYQRSILAYAVRISDQGQPDIAAQILWEVELFLRQQAIYLPEKHLASLKQALVEVSGQRQNALQALEEQNHAHIVALLGQGQDLLRQNSAASADELLHLKTQLLAVDPQSLPPERVDDVTDMLASIEYQELSIQARALSERIQELIEQAKNLSADSGAALFFLASAEEQMLRMVPLAAEISEGEAQIVTLSTNLDQARSNISSRRAEKIWGSLDEEIREFLKVNTYERYQDAIDHGISLRNSVIEKSIQIYDPIFSEKITSSRRLIDDHLMVLSKKQLESYNAWAIEKIKVMGSEGGDARRYHLLDDKEAIFSSMLSNLGQIETRALADPVAQVYQEVFAAFFRKLETDQKIQLSENMVLGKKVLPSDF